ncbi:MAG: pentapeptide repeat-containing protein [Desulfomonile tiedjei]|nr:pentapeptide repeat-containing protein [Desulfomonile tiedjei]
MRTVTIKAIEIVHCIRSGMDDATLMQKFRISARGLQRLFNELESAGILNKSELEERLSLSYGSVIVDIDHAKLEPLAIPRIVVDALEARNCIRSGMDDTTLMQKYNLSAKGLQSLFNKLMDAGAVSHSEWEERKGTWGDTFVVDEGAVRPRPAFLPVDSKGLLVAVKSGASREALSEKFKISAFDLENALAGLLNEGFIEQSELDRILPATLKPFHIRKKFSDEILYIGEATSFRALVEKAVASNVDLSEAELSGVNLARGSLSGARLSGSNLRSANLMGADLTGARLCGASLASADMSRAVLYKANLAGADLSEANLAMVQGGWAFLAGANLSETNLVGADFSGANLAGAYLFEAIVEQANFYGAYLEKTVFQYDGSRKSS